MCVCVCVFVRACVCAWAFARGCVSVYVSVCACVDVYMCTHAYISTYMHAKGVAEAGRLPNRRTNRHADNNEEMDKFRQKLKENRD